MIRRLLTVVALIAGPLPFTEDRFAAAAEVSPGGQVRIFFPITGSVDGLVEGSTRLDPAARRVSNLGAGAYWHVLPSLRTGLFVREERGSPYSASWVQSREVWVWRRSESNPTVVLDLTPRWSLSDSWMAEVRIRPAYGFSWKDASLRIRPGLTYAIDPDSSLSPLLFVQAEAYFSNLIADFQFLEGWLYLGGVIPLNSWFEPGVSVAYRGIPATPPNRQVWENSWVVNAFVNLRLGR